MVSLPKCRERILPSSGNTGLRQMGFGLGAGGGKDGGVAWVQAKDIKGVILTEPMMFCAGMVFRRPLSILDGKIRQVFNFL